MSGGGQTVREAGLGEQLHHLEASSPPMKRAGIAIIVALVVGVILLWAGIHYAENSADEEYRHQREAIERDIDEGERKVQEADEKLRRSLQEG